MSTTITCAKCDLYDHLRGPRIRAEIHKRSEGEEAEVRYQRFIDAYHARHARSFTIGRYVALMAEIQRRYEAEGGDVEQLRSDMWGLED